MRAIWYCDTNIAHMTTMQGFLNIPAAVSIGLHTCLWMAAGDQPSYSSAAIARHLGFSYHHVAKVVQRLGRAGIIAATRGSKGGIRLARDPRRLTLLDIYLAAGGTPREPHRCLLDPSICPGRACAFGHLVERENNRLHHTMQKTTLARLARTFDRNQLESP